MDNRTTQEKVLHSIDLVLKQCCKQQEKKLDEVIGDEIKGIEYLRDYVF